MMSESQIDEAGRTSGDERHGSVSDLDETLREEAETSRTAAGAGSVSDGRTVEEHGSGGASPRTGRP